MKTELSIQLSELFVRIVSFDYFAIRRVIGKTFGNRERKTILDLGCGMGILAPLFPKKGYLGIDLDKSYIEYAKKSHKGYIFQPGDITKIRLRKKFDYILVVGVIHHMNDVDAQKFFHAIQLHLKKGGRALIIEAIPPILWFNIPGQIIRLMDRGVFIRSLDEYGGLIGSKLEVKNTYLQYGGIADYGVLVLCKRDS